MKNCLTLNSIPRQRRINFPDPAEDAAGEVDRFVVAFAEEVDGHGAALADLADHDLGLIGVQVVGVFGQGLQGDEFGAGQLDDGVFRRLAHIDKFDVVAAVEHGFEFGGRDGRGVVGHV